MKEGGGQVFCFEGYSLDLRRGCLRQEDRDVELRAKSFEVLRHLVENAGRLVSKEELMQAVWPDVIVTDDSLTQCISDVRRAVRDDAHRIIKTVLRRGYLFAAVLSQPEPVQQGGVLVTPAARTDAAARSPAVPDDRSLKNRDAPGAASVEKWPAERRQLTVLVCELVGLAALSARLDPEDLSDMTAACRRGCIDILERHRGHVVRCSGDGILAYFGYPQAEEHDGERAVRAGLALAEIVPQLATAAGISLQARIGIATGPVVVGDIMAVGAALEQAVVGGAPNLAARLRALAEPGAVVISSGTRRLTGGLFDYRGLGATTLDGFADAVSAWRVSGAGASENRFAALRATTMPLVGRGEEVELLLRRWDQAKAGDGQIVLISGEPGIGKSRLAQTLLQRLVGEPHTRLRYFCSPHHQDSALWPAIRQFEHAAGFRRDDTAEQKLAKIEALLALTTDDLGAAVPLAANLLSVPTSGRYPALEFTPQKHKAKTLHSQLAQIEGLAAARPVLIWYEDLHWSDPMTRESLDLLVERAPELRVLVMLTFRPEFAPPWVGQPNVTLLSLNRLPPRRRAEMILHVAGGKALPQDIAAQIADRTDGVPLFIEELTKSVVESGVLETAGNRYSGTAPVPMLAIPTSLQISLLARLDRLPSTREVVQIAAALGRDFSHELVAAVAAMPLEQLDRALGQLVQAELIHRRGTPPDAEYSFKHALIRDAADSTLLRGQRQQLHSRIVTTIESRFPDIAASQPRNLGRHCREAGLLEKAVEYWLKAGQQALARSAMTEAEALCREGLAARAELPDTPQNQRYELELRMALLQALFYTKPIVAAETGEALSRARALAEALDLPEYSVRLIHAQWLIHLNRAELVQALPLAEQIEKIGAVRGDPGIQLTGSFCSGLTRLFRGELVAAQRLLQHCYALSKTAGRARAWRPSTESDAAIIALLAQALLYLGHLDQARLRLKEALSEAGRLGQPQAMADVLSIAAWIDGAIASPDLPARVDHLMGHLTEHGFQLHLAGATLLRGWSLSMRGASEEGLAQIMQGLAAARDIGAVRNVPGGLIMLARAYATLGQLDRGLKCLNEAEHIVAATGQRMSEAQLHQMRGELLDDGGDQAMAEQSFRRAIEVAQAQRAKLFELQASIGLARLWRKQGKCADAQGLLAPIYGWFTEGFDFPDLQAAKSLIEAIAADAPDAA